jgi:hypothetical protein
MGSGVGLPGSAQHVVALVTWRKPGGFIPGNLGEGRKAIVDEMDCLKRRRFFMARLPLFEQGGSATGRSQSPIRCHGPGGDAHQRFRKGTVAPVKNRGTAAFEPGRCLDWDIRSDTPGHLPVPLLEHRGFTESPGAVENHKLAFAGAGFSSRTNFQPARAAKMRPF